MQRSVASFEPFVVPLNTSTNPLITVQMEDLKGEERHKLLADEIENKVEGTVEPIGKDAAAAPTMDEQISEHQSSAQPAVENVAADQAEISSVNDINTPAKENQAQDPSVDAVKEPTKDDIKSGESQPEVPIKESVSSPSERSKRVQEGQKWNDRDREKQDYTKNIKSDLISQEESDDPVAIRKQVSLIVPHNAFVALIEQMARSNSISPIPTSPSISFSFLKLKDMPICQSRLVLSSHSSACATSSP